MPVAVTLPRLTTAIRVHGNVSCDSVLANQNGGDVNGDSLADCQPISLQRKAEFKRRQDEERTLTWDKFKLMMKKMCNMPPSGFHNETRGLYQIGLDLAGRDSAPSILNTAPVVLFFTLIEDPIFSSSSSTSSLPPGFESHHRSTKSASSSRLSNATLTNVGRHFGSTFPRELVDRAVVHVTALLDALSSRDENLRDLRHAYNSDDMANGDAGGRAMFGAKVRFKFPSASDSPSELTNDEATYLLPWAQGDQPLDPEEEAIRMLSMPSVERLQAIRRDAEAREREEKRQRGVVLPPPDPNNVYGLSPGWLKDQLSRCSSGSGLSVEELTTSVVDILASSSSNDAIQNDLFNLIGMDGFDMILDILQKRKDILHIYFDPNGGRSDLVTGRFTAPSQPQYCSQVTVLTEREQEEMRQLRKEQKKMKKNLPYTGETDTNDFVERLKRNPEEIARQRQWESSRPDRAASVPLRYNGATSSAPKYPFVFDKMISAHTSAAFIGSTKLAIPDDCVRNNNKVYEEIKFPINEKAEDALDVERVTISDLDDIAQVAFKGTKRLNLIQSVVYETAYGSNENLLISAPTGAGKTNIAMLTILHEIKQHLAVGNVIKKDEFKIIYVAPMKALAAEMTRNFGGRLAALNIKVRECTGDMSLTKMEILETQMLVTTPEKWDVITRKSTGDVALVNLVKLLIIDEVHLLHEDRGAVIETLVARTLRQVESSQRMIRIVGLSATLPNYLDVARFLRVNPHKGLFYFDSRFRPVPLGQTFVGIKATNRFKLMEDMNFVCYQKVLEQLKQKEQVMVFVHARGDTYKTAGFLRDNARQEGEIKYFMPPEGEPPTDKTAARYKDSMMRDLVPFGLGCHHAGMLRSDRNLVEKMFSDGTLRVLVCTATLAWGVNLPAHAVIIKGTQIYDSEKSQMVDLGILDVLQIFGRAGRPQFDTVGYGTIITSHDKLAHYLSLITRQNPIESQFILSLTDNLNAEVALGTVTNVDEAVRWLSYTYLHVRMRKNPLVYGLDNDMVKTDPQLLIHRENLIRIAARNLDQAQMIRFDERTGYLSSTDLGRTASHYYIKYATVDMLNQFFKPEMMDPEVYSMIGRSAEFGQIKVREEEGDELSELMSNVCHIRLKQEGLTDTVGKVNVLFQAYICRAPLRTFSLISDQAYIQQNCARLVRCLFEIALRKGWPLMAAKLLELCKMVERRMWSTSSPLWQFEADIRLQVLLKVDEKGLSIDTIKELNAKELGNMLHDNNSAHIVKKAAHALPLLEVETDIQPITRSIIRLRVELKPTFRWVDKWHTSSEGFWLWVEDTDNPHIYHSEFFSFSKKQVMNGEVQNLVFTIPIFEPIPAQYILRCISDRWLGAEVATPISFKKLILPEAHPPHTKLLDLQPLPVSALKDPVLEGLFKFTHFNPIQTQIFHTLYHTDTNVLLGAPTGSGKTVAAELAIFRVFRELPGKKCVYIAPLKALVRERMEDWKNKIEKTMNKTVVELTGDVTPDMRAVAKADLIVTTPEKWDGVSRSWQQRSYVQDVVLLVIDEIHLLGEDRGPVLEVIVSRTNFISAHTKHKVRVVGLSTALANARDLANWLNISSLGLFNFRPSVRPVPLEVHIQGFPGRHYCPRMATMNKPLYQAIRTHSPVKPTICFVSSRRQTRLTAFDLIAFLGAEDNPKQWVHMPDDELDNLIELASDSNLKLCLAFGIGLHHAGLAEKDRKMVEELFVSQKIQLLIATATLAWGVNFPAHLVVVKGTEFFDGKTKRYVDYPVTDVLQMMGRAGRPQYDDQGKAVIMVHDVKKHFYKRFLYEPFPVESNLLKVFADHLNAEIVAGTINSKQDAVDYITWTYLFRRLIVNPTFYGLDSVDHTTLNTFLSCLVERCVGELTRSDCVEVGEDNLDLEATTPARICSYYYLNHVTMRHFKERLSPTSTLFEILDAVTYTEEYAELPVRHNEDQLNADLANSLPLKVPPSSLDSPHTKAYLLFQAHFCRAKLPIADYITDTKSVLDQAVRILQAIIDFCADQGWLATCLRAAQLIQMVIQGRWLEDSSLLQLPYVDTFHLIAFKTLAPVKKADNRSKSSSHVSECDGAQIDNLPQLIDMIGGRKDRLEKMLHRALARDEIDKIFQVLQQFPIINFSVSIRGWWEESTELEDRPVPLGSPSDSHSALPWTPVHADQEYTISIKLDKVNFKARRPGDTRAYAPRFAKPKDEGWILMLGDPENRELLAIRRLPVLHRSPTHVTLTFYTPDMPPGRVTYYLYAMSDCYQGLDQQLPLRFQILPVSPVAQSRAQPVEESSEED